jgi:hypothetical protein
MVLVTKYIWLFPTLEISREFLISYRFGIDASDLQVRNKRPSRCIDLGDVKALSIVGARSTCAGSLYSPAPIAWLYPRAFLQGATREFLNNVFVTLTSLSKPLLFWTRVWYHPVIWPLAALHLSRRRAQWLLCDVTMKISLYKIFRFGHKRNNYHWWIKYYEAHIVYEHVSQAFNYHKRHNFMSESRKSFL